MPLALKRANTHPIFFIYVGSTRDLGIPEGISESNFSKAVRWHQQVLTSGYSNILDSGSPNTAPKKCPARMLWFMTGHLWWQFKGWSRFIGGLAHLRLSVSRPGVMAWTVSPLVNNTMHMHYHVNIMLYFNLLYNTHKKMYIPTKSSLVINITNDYQITACMQ